MRGRGPAVDTAGLHLPRRALKSPLDVFVDGRRVFSYVPGTAVAKDNPRLLPWPEAIRKFVHGTARVTVRTRAGRAVIDDEFVLDKAPTRMRVEDRLGHLQVVDKHGRLQRTFEESGSPDTTAFLDQVEATLAMLEGSGVHAFLTAGALLGAVRDGHLIGHDSDVDVAYLSRARTPAGVALESYRLERRFRQERQSTRRFSAAEFKLLLPGPSGATTGIDVRAAWIFGDMLYVAPNVGVAGAAHTVLPLGEISLEGRVLPAPADAEALLTAMYGPRWRIPDPSFTLDPPAALTRRLDGWIRGSTSGRSGWQRWHLARRRRRVATASSFAQWVAARVDDNMPIVDVGCGAGDDALWFAETARPVLGLDYASHAVTQARGRAATAGLSTVSFEECSFGDLRHVLAWGGHLARADTGCALYARQLFELLDHETRDNVLLLASMALRRGGRLYVELGEVSEPNAPPVVAKNARRLAPDAFAEHVTRRGGLVEHRDSATDDSPGGTQRTRMVVRWQR